MLSGGKTVTGVRFCYDHCLISKKKVISNIFLDFGGKIKVEIMPFEELIIFLATNYTNTDAITEKFKDSILFLDEVVNLISARKSNSNLNELITNFLMMVGKLDCDVFYTYQIQESQVDLRLREITQITSECYRLTSEGFVDPLDPNSKRILHEKVYILVVEDINKGKLGISRRVFVYDPTPYYQFYKTREITLLDRQNYASGGSKDIKRFTI